MSEEQTQPPQLCDLQEQLAQSEAALTASQQQLEAAKTQHALDCLLIGANARDLEVARLIAERQMQNEQLDADTAVQRLIEDRPYLFVDESLPPAGAMAPRASVGSDPVLGAAQTAEKTGNRKDLLDYLRLRRAN